MPIYDFECDDCKALEEVMCSYEKSEQPLPCGTCGGEMHKKVSSTKGVYAKGKGTFKHET